MRWRYGKGLWDEPWSEFYGNLARSVQPYAHYTTELQGWQLAIVSYPGGGEFVVAAGLQTYDPLQATRITLFHMLLTWMLGRMLLAHHQNALVRNRETEISELGRAIAKSKLLFHGQDWGAQLAPHVLFMPGRGWWDDA